MLPVVFIFYSNFWSLGEHQLFAWCIMPQPQFPYLLVWLFFRSLRRSAKVFPVDAVMSNAFSLGLRFLSHHFVFPSFFCLIVVVVLVLFSKLSAISKKLLFQPVLFTSPKRFKRWFSVAYYLAFCSGRGHLLFWVLTGVSLLQLVVYFELICSF